MIKRLIEDLEMSVSDRLQQSTKEYWNIKDLLTRLEQVDLDEYEHDLRVYERVTNSRGQAFRDVLNILKEDL